MKKLAGGIAAFITAAVFVQVLIFVPGAYALITDFFSDFGGFLGAGAGVFGAYRVAVWQMQRERHDHRTVIAHSVGLPLVDVFNDLRQDIEDITSEFMGTSNDFRVPGCIRDWRTDAVNRRPPPGTELYNRCQAKFSPYRAEDRRVFWSARDRISDLEYEDYFRLYLVYKKIDFIITQYQRDRSTFTDSVPAHFALTLENFIDIENNALDVLESLRRKYDADLPHLQRRPPTRG